MLINLYVIVLFWYLILRDAIGKKLTDLILLLF